MLLIRFVLLILQLNPRFCKRKTQHIVYIEFVNRDETQDYDSAMKALQSELTDLLKQEEESKKELLGVFKDLGYEIKL